MSLTFALRLRLSQWATGRFSTPIWDHFEFPYGAKYQKVLSSLMLHLITPDDLTVSSAMASPSEYLLAQSMTDGPEERTSIRDLASENAENLARWQDLFTTFDKMA